MSKIVDYYLSLASPWTYLGSRRIEEIVTRHRATLVLKPVSFAEIFPRTGGLPLPKRAPERQAYRLVELERWRKHLGMPLNLHPAFFPVDDSLAALMAIAAIDDGRDPLQFAHAVLKAVWAEEQNIADSATLEGIANTCGLDGKALLAKAEMPELKEKRKALNEEAISRGVFGAPSYVYRDEIFWGQDRLDFLDRALAEG